MKVEEDGKCGGICYCAGFVFILILILVILSNTNIIDLADSSPGLAGWAQAFGSVLAIIATWMIATRQRNSDNNNEKRRTVLEAVTMFHEIRTVMNLLDNLSKSVDHAINYPKARNQNSVNIFTVQVNAISLRSLKDQSILVNVGDNYIESARDIINDLSVLKNFVNLNSLLYDDENKTVTDYRVRKIYDDVSKAYKKCSTSAEILRLFASQHGIELSKIEKETIQTE